MVRARETEASFVLYRADPTATEWTELCLRQADCLVVVRAADDELPTRLPFEIETAQSGAVFHRRRELVLLHEGHDPKPGSTAPMLAGGLYGQHHHVRLDIHADIDRLARLLTGHAVGVVMAGGGARAFTHIGVVKALRASGVPIDQVGGTSMGAIVGGERGLALGRRGDRRALPRRLRRHQSAQRLHAAADLAVRRTARHAAAAPVVRREGDRGPDPAVLLRHGEPHDRERRHPHGRLLWRWLRASVAIPGVMPPFNEAGEVHVDGGVIDNFPVRAMRRRDAAPRSASTSTPAARWRRAPASMEPWSAWQFFRRLIWKRNETLPIPSIVAILLRSALVASAARAAEDRQAADLLIVPPMTHIDLLDWTSFDAAIEVGYRTTMEALDKAKATPMGARLFLA